MFVNGLSLRMEVYRKELRMRDLADRAGISVSTLSGIANGKRCRPETAQKIADALDVPLEKLICGVRKNEKR